MTSRILYFEVLPFPPLQPPLGLCNFAWYALGVKRFPYIFKEEKCKLYSSFPELQFAAVAKILQIQYLKGFPLDSHLVIAMIEEIDCNFTRNGKSMDYLSIRDIAAKFAMPERTVYYHVANSSDIRRKKQ